MILRINCTWRNYLFSVSKKGWDAKYRSYAVLLFYILTLFRCFSQKPNSGGGELFMPLPTLAPPSHYMYYNTCSRL